MPSNLTDVAKAALVRAICLALLAIAVSSTAHAQGSLQGKQVAIYFSKKYFTFPEEYRFLVPGFILSDQGRDTPLEDLRQQTLISLGGLVSAQLDSAAGTQGAWFLNERPEMASLFLQHYASDSNTLEPMGGKLAQADLVLVVNPLTLTSYRRKIVYVRSDKVVSEYEMVKVGRMTLTLLDPATGSKVASTQVCYDAFKDRVDRPEFDFRSKASPLGKFLSELFTLGILQLEQGIASTCD